MPDRPGGPPDRPGPGARRRRHGARPHPAGVGFRPGSLEPGHHMAPRGVQWCHVAPGGARSALLV